MQEIEEDSQTVDCLSPDGKIVALIKIEVFGKRANEQARNSSLIKIEESKAKEFGEARIQIREHGRYRYEIKSEDQNLILRETSEVIPDSNPERGAIEPSDHCGRLTLEVVHKDAPDLPIAFGEVEVRSIKVGYRKDYRGMLNEIARRSSALLVDSKISTRVRLEGSTKDRSLLEQQFEFLRNLLTSRRFRGAVECVLRAPHKKLRETKVRHSIRRPNRAGRELSVQIAKGQNRITLPPSHPLKARLTSIPNSVVKTERIDDLDTPENRFVKMALKDFHSTLLEIQKHVEKDKVSRDDERILKDAKFLAKTLDDLLRRGFFPEVSRPTLVPHGSTILQRKEGYREIYSNWLQFHMAGLLKWEGGENVYGAGMRNVSTLYEYWLFFELENLFRTKFQVRRPLHKLLISTDCGLPSLVLNHKYELKTPVEGVHTSANSRKLRAEFNFNKSFRKRNDYKREGTWSIGARPDYTFTIWPAEFDKREAEANELLVHVHFDAKYKVDNFTDIIDADQEANLSEKQSDGTKKSKAKNDDLLKMHAYRDSIRRTAGAYVLYPGQPNEGKKPFKRFHEIIPGLGAFPVRPNEEGGAEGMDNVSTFLDEILEHLANRTTARERVSYHLSEAYERNEVPVRYGETILSETDIYGTDFRALPPAEHIVVVAWHQTPEQLAWTKEKGLANVRLGKDRPGSLHVLPEMSSARHLMLRTHGAKTHEGLWKLTKPGFKVYTAEELMDTGYPEPTNSEIYAVFEVETDENWEQAKWADKKIVEAIEEFEARRLDRLGFRLGRTSPKPRFISLKRLLEALDNP